MVVARAAVRNKSSCSTRSPVPRCSPHRRQGVVHTGARADVEPVRPKEHEVTQQCVDAVRETYDALNRGDADVIEAHYSEAMVFVEPEGSPWAGTYHGHDGFRDFLGRVGSDLEDMRLEPTAFLDAGHDQVVVESRVRATVRTTGEPFDLPYCAFARVQDGKIREFRTYRDTALAQRQLRP